MTADCMAADPIVGFTCDQPPGHDDDGSRHMTHTWDGVLLASWPATTTTTSTENQS